MNLNKRFIDSWRYLITAVVALAVVGAAFLIGLNVGNGNIRFSSGGLNNGLPGTLNYSSVTQEYRALIDNYDGKLTQSQLLNGLKHGLAQAANDPYTEYFTSAEAKSFNNELNNSFGGIGAELSQNSSGEIEVMSPLKGYPAAKAGLQAKDIIADINGNSTANS